MKPRIRFVPGLRMWKCSVPFSRPVGWGYDPAHAYQDWRDAIEKTENHHV